MAFPFDNPVLPVLQPRKKKKAVMPHSELLQP